MRKSKLLASLAIMASMALVGCSGETSAERDARIAAAKQVKYEQQLAKIKSRNDAIEQCVNTTEFTIAECSEAYDAAFTQDRPRYASRYECENEFGPAACRGSGSNFYPLLTGYMIGSMLSSPSHSTVYVSSVPTSRYYNRDRVQTITKYKTVYRDKASSGKLTSIKPKVTKTKDLKAKKTSTSKVAATKFGSKKSTSKEKSKVSSFKTATSKKPTKKYGSSKSTSSKRSSWGSSSSRSSRSTSSRRR